MDENRIKTLETRVSTLQRKVRNTRVGIVFGLGAVSSAMYFGIHHLADMHHKTFKNFYNNHKRIKE